MGQCFESFGRRFNGIIDENAQAYRQANIQIKLIIAAMATLVTVPDFIVSNDIAWEIGLSTAFIIASWIACGRKGVSI